MKKFVGFLLVSCMLVAGGWLGYKWILSQMVVAGGEAKLFEGASVKEAATILERSGVIPNDDVFYLYIRYHLYKHPDSFSVSFKHGEYEIEGGDFDSLDFDSLIEVLNEGPPPQNQGKTITIPEGFTLVQMGNLFQKENWFTKQEWKAALSKENYERFRTEYEWLPQLNSKRTQPFEGLLQGNTYEFSEHAPPLEILDKMMAETNNWYDTYQEEIANQSFTFYQLLILSSVVEKESKFSEDRPKVAQVFYNRLKKGMKLESDITAAYALGEHKTFMTYKDISVKSPYNTYHVEGLPIGPIASPSLESFLAVLRPSGPRFKALYFYARPSGETFYANTFQEHEKNRLKWEHEWLELAK